MKLSSLNATLKQFRKENIDREFVENDIQTDPFAQFLIWFEEALTAEKYDPTAMILATVDEHNWPNTRVVLLKELEPNRFIFYSSYGSKKSKELNKNNIAALNFYWPEFSRQVRMRGPVERVHRKKSEAYFATRPRNAQLCTHAWTQSAVLENRNELDANLKLAAEKFVDQDIFCPENWGGFVVTPFEYEFFQGRTGRMHDRIFYSLRDNNWETRRLAP